MHEVIGIALFLTLIVSAITGASFAQGVGVFIVMFIAAAAFVSMTYENVPGKSVADSSTRTNDTSSGNTESRQETEWLLDGEDQPASLVDSQEPRQFSSAINAEIPEMHLQYAAGERYFYGKDGVDQNDVKAAECYKKSAGHGYIHAYRMLGLLYSQGKGVPLDYLKAIECYTLAKAHNHSPVEREIKRLRALLTTSQVDQLDQVKSEKFEDGLGPQHLTTYKPDPLNDTVSAEIGRLYLLAKGGDTQAQVKLGEMYFGGKDVPQDLRKAAVLFLKAAKNGSPDASFYLGTMCENGRGMPKDSLKAMEWYVKAAKGGNTTAQLILSTRVTKL